MSEDHENPTGSDSIARQSRIASEESDRFVTRLREVIGAEPVAAFARRCGLAESGLRGYLHDGKKPGMDYLVAIADAGGVSVDWLATGRGPRRRAPSAPLEDRRLAALLTLLDQLTPEDREDVLSHALSRAQTAQRLKTLLREVADLKKKRA